MIERPRQGRRRVRVPSEQSHREMVEVPDVPGQLIIDEAYADYAGIDALVRVDDGRDSPADLFQGLTAWRARAWATPSRLRS